MFKRFLILISFGFFSSLALASSFPKVDADLRVYDDHVAALNESFQKIPSDKNSHKWVSLKLQHMVDVDQYMRRFSEVIQRNSYSEDETREFWSQFLPRWQSLDRQNTLDFKELFYIHGWFTIGVFGKIADNNAWLLVQHADHDPDFQREILVVLEALVRENETSPPNFAYLFDRVAASWNEPKNRRLQRFGTQGNCTGPGIWEPIPVEDPSRLDERRKEFGLGPQAEYVAKFKDICH